MAPDISKKKKKKRGKIFGFLSAVEYTCNLYGTYTLKFIWYMTNSKIQVEFEKRRLCISFGRRYGP